LSSRPERTRISYFALLATTTCAALREESRIQTLKARLFSGNPGERSGEICGLFYPEYHCGLRGRETTVLSTTLRSGRDDKG
jgi:hypothetical protein